MRRPNRTVGTDASLFAFLDSDVRLSILESLYEHTVEAGPMTRAATYTTIREDVGVDDSGRFNYHLEKLTGRYVAKYDDGYGIREPGREVVRLRRTGILSTDPHVEPERVDASCYRCGSSIVVGYDHGHVITTCPDCPGLIADEMMPDGTLSALPYPPSGVLSVDIETAFERAHRRVEHEVRMLSDGFCYYCGGDVTASVDPCRDHDAGSGTVCDACNMSHPGFVDLSCDWCGLLRLTHPLFGHTDREPIEGIIARHDLREGWERFAEVMRWPVVVDDDGIHFEPTEGARITVTNGFAVETHD